MSTAQEIEEAIRAHAEIERDKLFEHLPQLFPQLAGDAEWGDIIRDDRPRRSFTTVIHIYEARLSAQPDAYPKVAESDFD